MVNLHRGMPDAAFKKALFLEPLDLDTSSPHESASQLSKT